MSWLLPSALGVGAAALIGLVAVHFIARSRPIAEPLPTARFIPERAIRARTRSYALSDIVLLLLRALAIVAICAAVAAPAFSTTHGRTARVIVADRSRDVASIGEVRDSVRALARAGDVIVPLDSAASRRVRATDSLVQSDARGSLSAGFAEAMRAGAELARANDSLELIVVSPFAREEIDHATARIRAAWPGRVRLVRVAPRPIASAGTVPRVEIRADTNDAVAAGLALAGFVSTDGAATVRVVRDKLTTADSAWATASGHVLVHWPVAEADADWPTRRTIDAIGGVVSTSGVLVARLPRLWVLNGTAIARWADGEIAAMERPTGGGCIRHVGVLIDESSDVTLRPPFRDFARGLLAPCGGDATFAVADSTTLISLGGAGPLAPAAQLRDDGTRSRWTPWLLAFGALVLIAELAVRRGPARTT
ncbi:MAG TPA: BatA domain-containing protein [Gemmatimonadaceae bacterium]|nr:BatA domain-containing protein [Gemmatimonadaceae bacterium]